MLETSGGFGVEERGLSGKNVFPCLMLGWIMDIVFSDRPARKKMECLSGGALLEKCWGGETTT